MTKLLATLGIEKPDAMDTDDEPPIKPHERGFTATQKAVKSVIHQGYSASQILSQVKFSYGTDIAQSNLLYTSCMT